MAAIKAFREEYVVTGVIDSEAFEDAGTRPAWCQLRYRGSMVRTGAGFDFWYSGKSADGVWHIGRTTMTPVY